ncbi:deoxynucleotidyltransferase terminal-interacting protein 1 isoform X3 [Macrosteles quadrilineatus]|nr:deoxynucleotidyltransferase terminal-interacting protein 1 isoform X3 [Macrosteles quadrilineatus]XP_054257848.1 deoxynucleotidyltransferase terminal-interacting protein 1 isoform X3 [Macrosteles quadrilineatus]
MVVHRGSSWDASPDTSHRSTLQAINQNTLSSDDATSICKLNSEEQDSVEWKNPFNMRQVILNNLSAGGRPTGQLRHSPWLRTRGRPVTNAAKSLDILRQNLQTSINKEIDGVLKKYLEKFFRPAIDNVRSNLGGSSVNEEHVREVCRAMLDEAKQMYCGPLSRGGSPFSDCETTSLIESRLRRTHTQSPLLRKRKESDTDSETSQTVALRKRISRPVSCNWDPARLSKDTLFILGSRANKVLGLGHVLGKGRLFIKHPQLFKYCSDSQDQDWLASHRHTLTPLASTKVYIMLLDEIKELVNSDEYRNSPSVLIHELKGFEAPDFMLKKIKTYMSQVKPQTSDDPESPSDTSQGVPSNLSVECVSSTMTPPATVLDSGPSTPSEALDLLDPPSYLTGLAEEQRRDDAISALLNRATTAQD